MKFLLAEILICLSAAGLLGLFVGWLMQAGLGRRKLARAKNEWDGRYLSLKQKASKEVGELKEQSLLLQTDNTTLISKVESLSAMVKSGESALLRSNNEIKSLTGTLASQQLTIKEITAESDKLVKSQAEMQQKLEALEKSKEQEIAALARQAGETPQGDFPDGVSNSSFQGSAPILDTPVSADTDGIDDKIQALNEQRDRLNREREELFHQEQLLASQLTRGDDTEAYLDQTIRIDDDMTAAIKAEMEGAEDDSNEILEATGEIDPADQTAAFEDESPDAVPNEAPRAKSLWDKLKLGVNRTDEKTS